MIIELKDQIAQDGARFYHEPTGRIVADYSNIMTVPSLDMEMAKVARAYFAYDFPEFVVLPKGVSSPFDVR